MDNEALAALIRRDEPDELWDIYDEAGNKTGRRRGHRQQQSTTDIGVPEVLSGCRVSEHPGQCGHPALEASGWPI